MLIIFIIDSANSLIVKDFNKKIILYKILVKVSNSLLNFLNRFISMQLFGGSSSAAEYGTVEQSCSNPKTRVQLSPAALIHCF